MAQKREPAAGGMTLREAYDRYADPEKVKIIRDAKDSIKDRTVIVGRPGARRLESRRLAEPGKKNLASAARREMNRSFRALLESGYLVAWVSEGTLTGPRTKVPAEAWPHLRIRWDSNTLATPENHSLRLVKIYLGDASDELERRAKPDSKTTALVSLARDVPVYTLVYDIWKSLPDCAKRQLNKHGGQKAVGNMICSHLPNKNPETVRREFREVLKDEREAKSGKKAG